MTQEDGEVKEEDGQKSPVGVHPSSRPNLTYCINARLPPLSIPSPTPRFARRTIKLLPSPFPSSLCPPSLPKEFAIMFQHAETKEAERAEVHSHKHEHQDITYYKNLLFFPDN
jgi:hypothetical protein